MGWRKLGRERRKDKSNGDNLTRRHDKGTCPEAGVV